MMFIYLQLGRYGVLASALQCHSASHYDFVAAINEQPAVRIYASAR